MVTQALLEGQPQEDLPNRSTLSLTILLLADQKRAMMHTLQSPDLAIATDQGPLPLVTELELDIVVGTWVIPLVVLISASLLEE